MDEIPEDIWEAARACFVSPEADKGAVETVARAILAERYRWEPAADYFWRYCQDEADNAEDAGVSNEQHEKARAFRVVVNNSGF